MLHCAAAKGQLKCLKIICKKNADIWLRNRRGDFPIHEAYYNKELGKKNGHCIYIIVINLKSKTLFVRKYASQAILTALLSIPL